MTVICGLCIVFSFHVVAFGKERSFSLNVEKRRVYC